jgi:hypothetical protein
VMHGEGLRIATSVSALVGSPDEGITANGIF